jgi:hypothetical protein
LKPLGQSFLPKKKRLEALEDKMKYIMLIISIAVVALTAYVTIDPLCYSDCIREGHPMEICSAICEWPTMTCETPLL